MGLAVTIDLYLVLAVLLLVMGVIGSLTPTVPGALFSIIGLLLYWWSTGFTVPSTLFMEVALAVGIAALLVDYLAGAIAARVGGASLRTTAAAAIVGVLLLFVVGPIGILVGVAGTVFALEFLRTDRIKKSARAALYATVGMLASILVQAVLTTALLVAFLFAVLL